MSLQAASPDPIYGLDDRPPLRQTLFAALQHVLAVFVGIITTPLIVASALKLGADHTAYLVSMSLFVSGAATILQTTRIGPVGSGLLSIQGTSFTFIAPIRATFIMFGMVAASGIRILARVSLNRRNSLILALSLGVGLGVTFVPELLQALPPLLKNMRSSGIATGGMSALLLNTVLPGER